MCDELLLEGKTFLQFLLVFNLELKTYMSDGVGLG